MSQIEFMEAWTGGRNGAGPEQVISLFRQEFDQDPEGVWSAPGRVNLIGEHTDYNAGLCLPIALPHRTFVAMRRRKDHQIHLVSSISPDNCVIVDLDGLEAGGVSGWASYVVGVAWSLRQAGYEEVGGFDMALASCVPVGSGLSSSAAMTCSTALALNDIFGLGLGESEEGRVILIQAAIKAENDMAGAATGGMDQSASMRCQAGKALRLDCRPELTAMENVSQVPFDLEGRGLELLVLDTQAQHQLNDGQYQQRRTTCEQAAGILGVENLRQVADRVYADKDPSQALQKVLDRIPDPIMSRRIRHVITEIGRVDQFIDAFGRGDISNAGKLLNASHDSLRDDYQVTSPELDLAVDVAREQGAYGARMTGGGFGGSIIALVDAGQGRPLSQMIADRFKEEGYHQPRALSALPSSSAAREC